MIDIAQKYGAELARKSPEMIERVMQEQYRRHPELKTKYGAHGMQRCREDLEFHFGTLTEAVASEEKNLWLNYVAWGKIVLVSRKIRIDDLLDTMTIMQEAISANLSKRAAARANAYIDAAIKKLDTFPEAPPSFIDPCAPLQKLANSYLQALLSVDRNEARKLIRAALRSGARIQDLYKYVFEPVQKEIGRLWQMNHISVAQEHYCTATTEMLLGEINRECEEIDRGPHFFLGTCVAGVQHSIGIRMISELLGSNGWKVYYTGANTPSANLVDLISKFHIDVLGISAATAKDLGQVRELIGAVRTSNKAKTKIMVGGRIFNEYPSLWKKVGADATAKDALAAVDLAYKLVGVDGNVATTKKSTRKKAA